MREPRVPIASYSPYLKRNQHYSTQDRTRQKWHGLKRGGVRSSNTTGWLLPDGIRDAVLYLRKLPDPTGYVTVLHKTDGSLTQCVWHNISEELDRVLEREATKGVRHVTVGGNDSFVVILNNGEMRWSRVPKSLHRQSDDAERRGRAVLVSVIYLNLTDG